MSRRSKAFTLIELLVVVSVIAVLIALLLPAVTAAKQMAGMAVCLSNEQQQAIAVSVYQADNEDFFPTGWNFGFQFHDSSVYEDVGPYLAPPYGLQEWNGLGTGDERQTRLGLPLGPDDVLVRRPGAPATSDARSTLPGSRNSAAEPEAGMGFLNGIGLQGDVFQLVKLSLMRHVVLGPQANHERQRFVIRPAPGLKLVARVFVVRLVRTDAHARV